jgi:hypothetical protein
MTLPQLASPYLAAASAGPGQGTEFIARRISERHPRVDPGEESELQSPAKAPVNHRKEDLAPPRHGKVVSLRQEIKADNAAVTFDKP